MTEITLSKANKIRNILEKEETPAPQLTIELLVSDTAVIGDIGDTIATQEKMILEYVESERTRLSAISALRAIIAKANVEVGVDKLMLKIKDLHGVRRIRSDLIRGLSIATHGAMPLVDIETALEFNKKQETKQPPKRLRLRWFEGKPDDWLTKALGEDTKRTISEVEEARNELNNSTKIELPKELDTFLRDRKLLS